MNQQRMDELRRQIEEKEFEKAQNAKNEREVNLQNHSKLL